jgi:uncharacterized protein (TIGR02646 family)
MPVPPKKIAFHFYELDISDDEYQELQALAIDAGDVIWTPGLPLTEIQCALIVKYKLRVKHVFRSKQGRICCYCGVDLQKNRDAYDAEHILPKSLAPQFTFEVRNLAAACKPCNGAKGDHPTTVSVNLAASPLLPFESSHYSIIHPHLDEWDKFLSFDKFERIVPAEFDTGKGAQTIAVCKIHRVNAMRIADHFEDAFDGLVNEEDSWETLYTTIYSESDPAIQADYVEFLTSLANVFDNPTAIELLEFIADELV